MMANLTNLDNLSAVEQWILENPNIAKWVHDRSIFTHNGNIYLSSIEFYSEEDCLFYSLKFGLSRT